MSTKQNLKRFGLIAALAMVAGGQIRTGSAQSSNSGGSSLANTEWKGIYGSGTSSNIPATLRIYSQNGSLMGTLTYDGYEETVAITATQPRVRIKGVSYRDLRGGRTFDLDTFNGQISADGRRLTADGGDTKSVVANEWLRLQKVDSTSGGAPQPASQNFVRSLIGSNWNGAIAESQKGGSPAQMRIVQQNGAPTAILTWEGFEEVLALTFTAPSGIQMRGTSFRDLSNQGRSFTLDRAQGEVSPDGQRMQGQIAGRHFDFRRVQ
jgi:hypothetical protein